MGRRIMTARKDDIQDDINNGLVSPVKLENGEKIVIGFYDGAYWAVSGLCTHRRFPLDRATLDEDGVLQCEYHGVEFDLQTGEPVGKRATRARGPLKTYKVVEDGDELHIELE